MPPATPSAIIARMNRETVAALAKPDVRQGLAAQAVQATSSTPDELRERIRHDIEKWRTIAAEAGIEPEYRTRHGPFPPWLGLSRPSTPWLLQRRGCGLPAVTPP